jgi:acylphosphatase
MNRRTCYFSGRVQGVGFRYTVQNLAQQFAVTGYVRNTPDGRVELVMEGDDAQMQQLIEAINTKMHTYIRGQTGDVTDATGEFRNFSIRH